VAPPYTVTEDEIDEMVARLRRSIVDVLGELKD
jgi:adenosylmethionine-8-amino-7-oxononanoate aminotransferase